MTDEAAGVSEPDVMDLYDTGTGTGTGDGLVCRVCGSVVATGGDYPRVHWDWHEASNGA